MSETVEYWEKAQRTFAGPHIDLVLGRNGTSTRLMHADMRPGGTWLRSSVLLTSVARYFTSCGMEGSTTCMSTQAEFP